jgi:hypothetical protein
MVDDFARPSFRLESPWGRIDVRLAVHGAHMVANAVAAAAAGLFLDVPLADVAARLTEARLSPWRMDVQRAPNGLTVINDAYNANPTSMLASLDALVAVAVTGRRIAVVGLMAELGDEEAPAHAAVAEQAAERGITLVAVGTDLYGLEPLEAEAVADHLDGLALGSADAVLIKGSRVVGLKFWPDAYWRADRTDFSRRRTGVRQVAAECWSGSRPPSVPHRSSDRGERRAWTGLRAGCPETYRRSIAGQPGRQSSRRWGRSGPGHGPTTSHTPDRSR